MSTSLRRNLIIVLTLITALVHLVLLNLGMGTIDPLFTLNGLGFLALLYAYLNDVPAGRKSLVRWAFMAYTAVTILAWFALNGDFSSPVGLITKLDELLLLVLLATDR
jgi:hypothetical protein